jgi:2,5-dichloro-2,5-cyclohexadiene-1,4-diol dehydrogenase 1
MYDLKKRSVLVTGAGSGIGREAARLAAQAGASVTVADLDAAGGEETVKQIRAEGGVAQFVRTDISDEAQVAAMVAAAVSAYGRLDGAFNNAAIGQASQLMHEISGEVFRRAIDINTTGTFYCMKHEVAAMLKNSGGAIVNTSSAAGVTAFPTAGEYIASKHAVLGLTRAGALDYGAQGIRVNAVLPGATLTPMLQGAMAKTPGLEEYLMAQQPVGRLGTPLEIARAAIWLLSDHASFVTGACLSVDGGYTAK